MANYNFSYWQECRYTLKRVKDYDDDQSKQQDPEYLKKLEEEKTIALDFIRNTHQKHYTGTLSFDMYNQKFLTRMSIALHSNIQKKHLLVLRFFFVAREYEIELKQLNNNTDQQIVTDRGGCEQINRSRGAD